MERPQKTASHALVYRLLHNCQLTETTLSANDKKINEIKNNFYFWSQMKRAVDYIYIACDMSYDAITIFDQTKTSPNKGTKKTEKKLIKSEFKVE